MSWLACSCITSAPPRPIGTSVEGRCGVFLCNFVWRCPAVLMVKIRFPISNGQRLAWTQLGDSSGALHAHTFRLYVDGRVAELSALRCQAIRSPFSYECRGGLPSMTAGRHVLVLTSVFNGIESSQSEPLVVIVSVSTQTARLTAVGTAQSSAPRARCVPLRQTANALTSKRSRVASAALAALRPQQTAGFCWWKAERASVSSLRAGCSTNRLSSCTMQGRESSGSLSTRDPATHEPCSWRGPNLPSEGGLVLNVTRYLALGNSLGQGATIVSGLPFSDDSLAPLAVDGEGLLYVALPDNAVTNRTGAQEAPFGGAVLRVDRDRLVPNANGRTSPVLSYGYAQPSGLAIDPTYGRVWLAGTSDPAQSLASVGLLSREGQSWPLRPVVVDTSAIVGVRLAESMGSALAFAGKEEAGAALLIADDRLFPVTSTREGRFVALGELTLTERRAARRCQHFDGFVVCGGSDRSGHVHRAARSTTMSSFLNSQALRIFSRPRADVLGRVARVDHQLRVLRR